MINKRSFIYFTAFLVSIFVYPAVFAQVDVPRQTNAITYPKDEIVFVQFRGTTRFPRMTGKAQIKRTTRNGTEIELSVSKMPRPFELGAGYATYVLWAVSPEGQVDNLGEIRRRGTFEFDSKISVTTPLQTFALIVTAEPHFMVRRPSKTIMLENLSPVSLSGRTVATVKSIQYFGNSSDYFSDARTPEIAEIDYAKTPSTVLQAKQAIALAKYAGAQRDAAEELQAAETLAKNAENAWKAGRPDDQIDTNARQAISAAVKAEDTALARKEAREKRNEKARQDAEIQKAEDKYEDALQQIENLKGELAREVRARELLERDSQNSTGQVKELRDENTKLRVDLEKARNEIEELKVKLARIEGEKQASDRQREQQEKVSRLQSSIPLLMQSLKPYGTVRQNERGIVLTLNETYWASSRVSNFAPVSESKLNGLGNILANNTDYKIVLESHTDNKGTPDELQSLTQQRAQAVADKLTAQGVDQARIETKGYGASLPIAPNTTLTNRGKNRRIEVILVPNF